MQCLTFRELVDAELKTDDPLVFQPEQNSEWFRAEALRKSGNVQEAAPLFHALWEEELTAASGWRYAYCLRKAGAAEAALRAICRVAQIHAADESVLTEKTWCIYEARLKPAVAENSAGNAARYAEEMLQHCGDDNLTRRLLIFSLVKVARAPQHWQLVLKICEQLDPHGLSCAPRRTEERQLMSDRERYYYARLRAYLELRQWEPLGDWAERASGDFPRNQDFVRSLCRAWSELGDSEAALARLADLAGSGRCRWYILIDYARLLLQAGSPEEAWKTALEAARGPAEDAHKVGLWELMAKIALAQGNRQAAIRHLGWAESLRTERGWSSSPEVQEFRQQFAAELLEVPEEGWKRAAQSHWNATCAAPPAPSSLLTGVISEVMSGRSYCFVRSGKQMYYTPLRDVPESCRVNGMTVQFAGVPHFDPKKGKESLRAVQIRAATPERF